MAPGSCGNCAATGRPGCRHARPSPFRLDRPVRQLADRLGALAGHGRRPTTRQRISSSTGLRQARQGRLCLLDPERIRLRGTKAESNRPSAALSPDGRLAARRLAGAGCSANEIAAIALKIGHCRHARSSSVLCHEPKSRISYECRRIKLGEGPRETWPFRLPRLRRVATGVLL
mgnify:CR=1 FL=1